MVIGEYIINLNDSNLIKKLDDYAETIEVPQMKSAADCWEFFKSIYQDVCHHEPDPRLETLILASPATCDFFCVEHTYADIASYSTAEVWEQVMGQALPSTAIPLNESHTLQRAARLLEKGQVYKITH